MKKKISLFLFILFLFSCEKDKTEYKTFECTTDLQIEMFPDSSFFSDIRCMQYDQGHVYILDAKRRDVVRLDSNLSNIQITGTPGLGPRELATPYSFYVLQDTVYIMDQGSGSIKKFWNGQFIAGSKFIGAGGTRFFCTQNDLYMPLKTDSSTFAIINKNDAENNFYQYRGRITEFPMKSETMIRNGRHLLYENGDSVFYTVSDNLTTIEKYDLKSLSWISDFDLSDIPLVKENLKYIEQRPQGEYSYYVPVCDTYIANNAIYILYANLETIKCNRLIKISLYSPMKTSAVYTLPGENYDSFCVSDTFIFAANYLDGTIDKIKIPDYEEK